MVSISSSSSSIQSLAHCSPVSPSSTIHSKITMIIFLMLLLSLSRTGKTNRTKKASWVSFSLSVLPLLMQCNQNTISKTDTWLCCFPMEGVQRFPTLLRIKTQILQLFYKAQHSLALPCLQSLLFHTLHTGHPHTEIPPPESGHMLSIRPWCIFLSKSY